MAKIELSNLTFYGCASCHVALDGLLEEVGREGVEPSRPCGQEILSLRRLPFRHRPLYKYHDSIML